MRLSAPAPFHLGWWLLAYVSLTLGCIGIIVPGLPTVPFVLLAAYASARGSSRLHRWLLAHRQFGPMIHDWQEQGAVRRSSKWLASTMMILCGILLYFTAPKWWVVAGGCSIMIIVALWLWCRPEPQL